MARRLRLLPLFALLALAGCFREQVPGDAQLNCESDGDCPAGLKCRPAVGRCIDATKDSDPPTFDGLPEISPAVGRKGLPVAISFRASKELFADPTVKVGARLATVDEEGTVRTQGGRYRYLYFADGSESQTEKALVTVDMVDKNGNPANGLPAGSVGFDFVAPALSGTPVVMITPPPHSLVDPVLSVGVGAAVSVELTFDEALGEEPLVEAVWEQAADPLHPQADEVLSFLRRGGGPTTFTFEHVLAAAGARPQGRYLLQTTAKDAVGNEASYTLADAFFDVDTVAPDDPDVATEGRIVFRREPWGTEASGGARRMNLVGLAGAVGPRETLVTFTHDPHGELGRGVSDDKGAVQVPLIYVDLPKVWVQAVDGAGNASGEVLVRDLEWVATMAGKVAGSDTENPHQFVSRSWMGHGLLGRIGPGYGAYPQTGEALARVDAVSGPGPGAPDAGGVAPTVVRQTGEPSWSLRDVTQWPPYRCSFGEVTLGGSPVAYDLAHEQAVLVAGNGKTWIFNGLSWRPAVVADPEGDGDPSPRCGSALVYDERRGVVVMAGGLGEIGEVWEWNGSSWRRAASGAGPSPRTYPGAAYDRERGELVLFGGSPLLSGTQGDTWVWNGKSWVERKPAHKPPRRYGAGMTWDPASKSILMFGGITTDDDVVNYYIGDLWRWDGTDWTEIKPASTSEPWPPAKALPAFLEDSGRGKALLFGGRAAAHKDPDLLIWEWNGTAWSKRTVTPTPLDRTVPGVPAILAGRANSATFYDPFRRRVVLYGGYIEVLDASGKSQDYSLEEQWEWDPTEPSWRNLTPQRDPATDLPPTPGKRLMGGMVYDEQRRQTLLFGGAGGLEQADYTFGDALDDLWSWDGVQWKQVPKAGDWPSGRGGCGMAYDPGRGTMLVFGGWNSQCDTWEWDGSTGTWTKVLATWVQPCITTAMTSFDYSGALQTLRFGGLSLDFLAPGGPTLARSAETALWTGAGWSIAAGLPTRPSPRHMAAMAADGQGNVVLFGGEASTGANPEPDPFKGARRNDTWLWDGKAWTCLQLHDVTLAPPGRPEARFGHSLIFDPDRGRALLSDGWGAGPMVDYWDWDGTAQKWERRYPINPDSGQVPTPAFGRAGAYDRDRKRFVYFGGQTATESSREHWELDMGLGQRPGHVFSVSLARSNLPAEASLTRVQVHAVAGGRGSGTTDGVELWGWLPEGWQTLAEEPAASPDALQSVDAQVDDAARLAHLKFQDGLHFAIVPRGTNASRPAEVVTDYLEATVRYRLP
ncbi:MAG TPA: hypothetical protein VGK67_29985 [Myxococcales bacterium]|jgi:hypothetical protein